MSRFGKGLIAGVAALGMAGASLATATSAEARPRGFHGPVHGFHGGFRGGPRFGYGYGRGFRPGYVGAGLVGGLALGALAAGAYGGYGYGCRIETRPAYDAWGNAFWRDVRVCY
jgi:hypothetical protein